MTVTTASARPAGAARADGATGSVMGARRAPRHVLVGAALMVAFALLFGLAAFRADPATPVLAVARPVPAGQVITEADLQVVRVAPEAGVDLFGEAERSTVVGRTARVPLVEGSLLAPGQVGAAAWPPVGGSVVAVPVPAGRLPAGLAEGSRVSVLVAGGEGAEAAGPVVPASVVAVEPATSAGVSTVSLLMRSADAQQVGGAGEAVLILESPGGR